ncbi:MAG TPA: hypothetical protein VLS93_19465 [Anaeromyxobacteraceae bacterium]|nr:hypothetical protein [Anaeromyxobacteraceae bacterium]
MIPRGLLAKLEALLTAVAFAEEGEAETARRILAEAGMDDRTQHDEDDRLIGAGPHAPVAKCP